MMRANSKSQREGSKKRRQQGARARGQGGSDRSKMQPTNPNAHTHVNGTGVETHGYADT